MLSEEPKPYITKTKNGEWLIGLIPESYYIEVKRSVTSWSFRIRSFDQRIRYNTPWVKVDDIYKLETSRIAKKIRRNLDLIFPGKGEETTEKIISELELYQDYWTPESEELKPKEPTISDKLVELVLDNNVLLFCDQHDDPHIQIPMEIMLNKVENSESVTGVTGVTNDPILLTPQNNIISNKINVGGNTYSKHSSHSSTRHTIKATYKLSTKYVKEWIAGLMWKHNKIAPKSEAIKSALNVLAAIARENPIIYLYNRVASDTKGNWWLDMSNEKWEAIKITDDDWEIVIDPPIMFRRYSHQKPLFTPSRNGSIAEFLDYIRLTDVDHQLLYLISQISLLIPNIPHPITLLWGGKGTVKSTSQLITKKLIDNSSVGLLSMPSRFKMNELIQQLDHHYVASYDNLTSIEEGQSDVFCRAVTGLGVSKRQLYTDDEDVTRAFLRCVSMNGINLPADRPDLLDRAIHYETIPIPKSIRRPLSEIEEKFRSEASSILGAFLDVLVLARTTVKQIDLRSLNRMADFTLWGAAICEALGVSHEKFLVAYSKNINDVEIESLRASTVGDLLSRYLEKNLDRDKISSSGEIIEGKVKSKSFNPTELYQNLRAFADSQGISVKKGEFPANPREMSKKINEILPNLPAIGFRARRTRTRKERRITFSRLTQKKIDDASLYQEIMTDNVWDFEDLRVHFGKFGV